MIPGPERFEKAACFVIIGPSWSLRVLVVCRYHHEATGVIRMISARKATNACFKSLAQELGIPYQTWINLHLRDCAATGKPLAIEWRPGN